MKRFALISLAALALASCTGNSAKIEATVEGGANQEFIVKMLDINLQNVLDTVKSDNQGKFSYKISEISDSPEFYYLYKGDTRLASFLIKSGDKISLKCDTLGAISELAGSQESALLNEQERAFAKTYNEFDSLSRIFVKARNEGDEQTGTAMNYSLGNLYVKHKQASIKHLYQHPRSMSSVMLLYQKLPGDLMVFGDNKDALLFRRVYDSLLVEYPNSRYLRILRDEAEKRENAQMMESKIIEAKEASFPDIVLPDLNAKMRYLSDLSGKPFVLIFWTQTDTKQRLFNKELISLYEKYNPKGLEVFQVCVDTDKTAWARAVVDQKLPWINVCDGHGVNSQALVTYNISKVPTMFVMDKSGNIVAKDVYNISKLDAIISSAF